MNHNNLCCDEFKNFIKLKPKNIEEIYDDLFLQIFYNLELILLLTRYRDTLGDIPLPIKINIMKIITYIDNIITSFCNNDKYYSLYTDNKLFFVCMPFYQDFNSIEIIKISDGIDFSKLFNIQIDTCDDMIFNITNEFMEILDFYIPK